MPSADEHRAQAAENEAFYNEICASSPERRDWAVTILFYAMVHEVQAFLADHRATLIGYGIRWPVEKHHDRKAALRAHAPWSRLASYYGSFENWSRKTRYECFRPDAPLVAKMEDLLQTVREEIESLS